VGRPLSLRHAAILCRTHQELHAIHSHTVLPRIFQVGKRASMQTRRAVQNQETLLLPCPARQKHGLVHSWKQWSLFGRDSQQDRPKQHFPR
jgi:hypothetical protein